MWLTPIGERVLRGSERDLFVGVSNDLYEYLKFVCPGNEQSAIGEPVFDELSIRQKIYALYRVSKDLLRGDSYGPILPFAWQSAAIGAVYTHLISLVEEETGNEDKPFTSLLEKVLVEKEIPCAGLTIAQKVEAYRHLFVLSFADWRGASHFLDMPPYKCDKYKALLGLRKDYFSAPAPSVTNHLFAKAIDFFESMWALNAA
jgi:hypothetical protein